MQRPHKSVRKILNISELFVAVMNQQCSGEDTKDQKTQIGQKGLREDRFDHRTVRNFMKCNELREAAASLQGKTTSNEQIYSTKPGMKPRLTL